MARKFGGTYSPDQTPSQGLKKGRPAKHRAQVRSWLMFVAPLPLLVTGFGQISDGNPGGILRDFGAFAVMILAAWLLREGLIAQAAFDARRQAHRPALPRKILAALLSGLGLGLASFDQNGILLPVVIALLGGLLHLVAFGVDPLQSKGVSGFDGHKGKRVARAIDEAESHIEQMLAAMNQLGDRKLQNQLDGFVNSARAMFRTVEDDPRDLTSARKYLSVYLIGARDATVKFVDLYEKTSDETARTAYEGLLADLQRNFDSERAELLLDDRSDLDVEIEVLRDRLRHEGVSPE